MMYNRNFRKDVVGAFAYQHLMRFITENLLIDSEEFEQIKTFKAKKEKEKKERYKFVKKETNKILNIKQIKISLKKGFLMIRLPKL